MILPWLETQSTLDSARQLLGMKLSLGACSGLIVETEAYLGARDQAAHAFNHRHTTRNHSLFWRLVPFMFIECDNTAC